MSLIALLFIFFTPQLQQTMMNTYASYICCILNRIVLQLSNTQYHDIRIINTKSVQT